MKTNKSKISSGIFRGKTILLPLVEGTRPTKSIVKESAINTLRPEIPFTAFVEVFAGSGSVGLEALSNGATHVYFHELAKKPAKILRQNIDALQAPNATIIMGDSFETIARVVNELEKKGEKAIFYVDPPFHIREGQEDIYDKTIRLIASLPARVTAAVVIEHLSSFSFDATIGCYSLQKKKKFGNTTLSYYGSGVE